MNEHRRKAGIGALAGLDHADRAIAVRIQVCRKIAQDRVGILIGLIDQSGEVALGIKHDRPFPVDGDWNRGDVAAIPISQRSRAGTLSGPFDPLYRITYHVPG